MEIADGGGCRGTHSAGPPSPRPDEPAGFWMRLGGRWTQSGSAGGPVPKGRVNTTKAMAGRRLLSRIAK